VDVGDDFGVSVEVDEEGQLKKDASGPEHCVVVPFGSPGVDVGDDFGVEEGSEFVLSETHLFSIVSKC
jgi:hypothetical protein